MPPKKNPKEQKHLHHRAGARRLFFKFNTPEPLPAPPQHARKNQADMTAAEQDHFKSAIQFLIDQGLFGRLVSIHADMRHNMHTMGGSIGTQRFLPWHRVYLFELEQILMAHDSSVTIPYWDWVNDRQVPQWLQDFTPTVYVDGTPISVARNPRSSNSLPTQQQLDVVMKQASFTSFTKPIYDGQTVNISPYGLEGLHNTVHGWVGGTMGVIDTAPADPIFWLHHANVDRIWSLWKKNNPSQNPNLAGKNAIMDPWSYKEVETRKTEDFGYSYL